MKRSAVLALLVLVAVVIWASVAYVQAREEIKLTTIVPDQQTLRFKKGIVSETNYSPTVFPDTSIPARSLLVEGNVGIGTTTPNPQAKLDVNGSIAVGGQQGTAGQVLTSQGAGNTPTWVSTTRGIVSGNTAAMSLTGTGTYTVLCWATYFSDRDYLTYLRLDGANVKSYTGPNTDTQGADQNTIMVRLTGVTAVAHTWSFYRATSWGGFTQPQQDFMWMAFPE